MPELPDVEVFRRYLDAAALHQKITGLPHCEGRLLEGISCPALEEKLVGVSLVGTVRHGKYLFVEGSRGGHLVLHFGMTGFLRYFRREEKGPDHVRLLIAFENGYRLAYDAQRKLGRIAWTETVAESVARRKLGPDALELSLDLDAFADRLGGKRRGIKSALMDQGCLAGIGNVYSDEILFQAGIQPRAKVKGLERESLRELGTKTRHVLATAIDNRVGVDGWPVSWLLPHRQEGAVCPRCDGRIVKEKVAGRTSYRCDSHQREA